jgi:ribonuclease P protein component
MAPVGAPWRRTCALHVDPEQSSTAHRPGCVLVRDRCPEVVGETRDQAHVPAEQPAPGQDPRLPPAHAYACRSRDSRRSSAQGSRGALGLTIPSVLPAAHRMRRPADFEQAVRRGARGGRESLVVHVITRTDARPGPVVGFVVSKSIGNAVTRNRVKRRLRALVRDRLETVPSAAGVVVRALAPAATRDYANLGADLDAALAIAARRARRQERG